MPNEKSELPECCTFGCGAAYSTSSYKNGFSRPAVDWYECGSEPAEQSNKCRVICLTRTLADVRELHLRTKTEMAGCEDTQQFLFSLANQTLAIVNRETP